MKTVKPPAVIRSSRRFLYKIFFYLSIQIDLRGEKKKMKELDNVVSLFCSIMLSFRVSLAIKCNSTAKCRSGNIISYNNPCAVVWWWHPVWDFFHEVQRFPFEEFRVSHPSSELPVELSNKFAEFPFHALCWCAAVRFWFRYAPLPSSCLFQL